MCLISSLIMSDHYTLWTKYGIPHGDINVSNLMYDTTSMKGVLLDFDDGIRPENHQRVGTMPFMALDLLAGR